MIATDHRQSRQPPPTSDADSRADADSRSSFFSNRGSRRRQPTPTAALTSPIMSAHRESRQPTPTTDAHSRADADSRSSFFSNRGSRRRQPTPTAALTSGAAADVLSVPREVFLEVPDHWTLLISER